MINYIPLEVQVEIIKRLPVKSLLQFRSVSKRWKSLIDSSEFIGRYGVRHTQPRRLLVIYEDPIAETYVSWVDDDTFAEQRFTPTLPELTKKLQNLRVVGSSHGLSCLYGIYSYSCHQGRRYGSEMAVLWNPSIRKSVGIVVPGYRLEPSFLGFGVCPITNDPLIVKLDMCPLMRNGSSMEVEVFTLSTGSWRFLSGNLPNKSIRLERPQVVIDRLIYWCGYQPMVSIDGRSSVKKLIMSFDMITHKFKTVDMPDILAHRTCSYLSISKVSDALVVLEYTREGTGGCVVWIMNDGVPNSCTKLLTVNNGPGGFLKRVWGFTERGEPIIERHDGSILGRRSSMFVYEPLSQVNNARIAGCDYTFSVGYYMETLLLLRKSDCSVYVGKDLSRHSSAFSLLKELSTSIIFQN